MDSVEWVGGGIVVAVLVVVIVARAMASRLSEETKPPRRGWLFRGPNVMGSDLSFDSKLTVRVIDRSSWYRRWWKWLFVRRRA